MNFDVYQFAAQVTAVYPRDKAVQYPLTLLMEEVGELAGKFAKPMRKGEEFDKNAIEKEMGDVLWSLSALASDLGIDLQKVAEGNIEKLQGRLERGTLMGSGDER